MNKFELSIVKNTTIKKVIQTHPTELFDIVKKTYVAHHQKKISNPKSCLLKFQENPTSRIIGLPAAISMDPKVAGIKWIASNPENINRGLPRASAVIILNNYRTGEPYACLEGAIISITRTVYSAILATELLKMDKVISDLGIIGTGVIASHLLQWLSYFGWQIGRIHVYDSDLNHMRHFQKKMGTPRPLEFHDSFQSLIKTCDLIAFTTTAPEPYIENHELFLHNPIVLHLSLRDLAPSIILRATNFTDDIDHVLDANTSLHLTYQITSEKQFISGTLGDLLHLPNYIIDKSKPIIFSPMGMGMLDITLADFIHRRAVDLKENVVINDFLPQ